MEGTSMENAAVEEGNGGRKNFFFCPAREGGGREEREGWRE